ncbi:MAG: hypothetical protein WD533_07240 [Dehalococcoidia bacterium]
MQANREPSEPTRPESAYDEAPVTQPEREAPQPDGQPREGVLHRWPGSARRQERQETMDREPRGAMAAQPAVNAAQVVMLLIGIILVGVGAVALGRGGFDELNLHNQVMGIPHTPLLGFMELVLGAIIVLAAALPYAGRWVLLAAGALLFIFGLVVVITPATFNPALGTEALNGWIYIVTGVVTLLVAIIMPRVADWRRGV